MAAPSKKVIIDCLVLVFSKSKIKDIVGTDALRSVLDIQFKDLIRGEEFDMQGVWDLLAEQPGFDAEFAKPPIARFKQNEELFGITVKLPKEMQSLGRLELQGTAAHCPAPLSEMEKIVAKHDPVKQAARVAQRAKSTASHSNIPVGDIDARSKLPLLIGAIVVALAGFGFGGYTLYTSLNPSVDYDDLTKESFVGIPVASARRQGRQAEVTLSDDGWLAKKDSAALEAALRRLGDAGVEVIIVRKKNGKVAASVQFSSSGEGIRVQFR